MSKRQRRQMLFESLEQRSLLAQMIWDGGGNGINWSDRLNWSGDVAPAAGDDLVFTGAGAAMVNDLPTGTAFNTLEFSSGGFSVTGSALQLAGGLTANHTSGTNTVGLDITLQNAQTFMNANAGATLTITGGISTANIIGNYIFGTAPALIFDGAGLTNATGIISGAGSVSKLGTGTVVLGGVNTYEGITEARQGFIRVTSDAGLGSAATGHTEVQAGAAVELSGANTAENFVIRDGGVGFGSGTDISSAGALRGVGGVTSTITGNVELQSGNNPASVLIGAAAGSTLNISGQVLQPLSATATNRRFIKVGTGTLQLTGDKPNVIIGDVIVLQGTLELGKTGAGLDRAITANLIIGDNIGGDNAAKVRLLASNQIAQLNPFDVAINAVTLNSSGVLDLNGFDDTVGNITLTTGSTYSSDIQTLAGTLTLGGNITVSNFQGSSGATPAATISGKLDLGAFFSGGAAGGGVGATRTFSIADTQLANVATDLIISANITGAAGISWNKTGAGTLRLSGTNSGMAGPVIVNGGIVEVGSNAAFGTGLLSHVSGSLAAVGGIRTVSTPLSIDGTMTFFGTNSLMFTGPATLTGGRTFEVMDPAMTVTFAGPIGEGIFGSQTIAKSGRGTLALTAANTFSGAITVNDDGGTLTLSGAGSVQNSTNNLTVGYNSTLKLDNDSGGNIDRINDQTLVDLRGRIIFVGSSTADSIESFGQLQLQVAAHTIEIQNTSAGAFKSILTANTLNNPNGDRILNVIGTGIDVSATGQSRFAIVNQPGLTNAIINGGRVTSTTGAVELATLAASPEGMAVVAYPAAAYVTELDLAGPSSNLKLTAPGTYTLSASRTINSLTLGPGVTLTSSNPNVTLTVANGMVYFLGAGDATLSVGNLQLSNQGNVVTDSGMTATIASTIVGGSLINKAGTGKLILTGDNQYSGATNINEGIVNIQRSTALGSPAGSTTVRPGAVLELEETSFGPVNIGPEGITVIGHGTAAGAIGTGALRNVAGNNSIMGNVTLTGVTANLLTLYGGFPIINSSVPFVNVETASTLTLTGDFGGSAELAKIGGGTLELAGIVSRGTDRNNRIFEGTVLLNNQEGVQASRGRYFIGTDVDGAPAATLKLGASDQIIDDRGVTVFASGTFDLNGNSDLIGEGLTLDIASGGAGKVSIGTGGTLTVNAGTQVFTQGAGNNAGAMISGGTFALQQFGVISTAGTRTLQVNDGATGTDLTITSAIVDGTGLQQVGVIKNGFGAMEYGGTTANTYTSTTTVNEGSLLLNKTAGVAAFSGNLTIGDANVQSGFQGSDVVKWMQSNQVPDYLVNITLTPTGKLDLNGKTETYGVNDVQNALTMQAASIVDLGGGTLNLIGDINTNAAQSATLWVPIAPVYILNGTLNLGSVARTINVPDRAELPWEMEITANITGTQGFIFNAAGTLLLEGNNSGLSGDVARTDGHFAVGSDTAFGTGRVMFGNNNRAIHLTTYNGPRSLANEFVIGINNTTVSFIGGNNTAGSAAVGGGGNDLKFTGPVNLASGATNPNLFLSVPIAGRLEFAGGLGESNGPTFVRKQGFGAMVISAPATFSANLEIGQDAGAAGGNFVRANGGHVILRDNGSLLNSSVLVGYGGVFQIDNTGLVNNHRFADATIVDLAGGTLALVAKNTGASSEIMGQLRPRNNDSTSVVQSLVPAGASATWRFQSYGLETANEGATVKFVGRGTDLSSTSTNKIGFITSPTLVNSIISTAVLEGSTGLDFVTIVNPNPTTVPGDNFITPLTSGANFATTLAGATATTNVKLAAGETLGGATTANALLLNGGKTVGGAVLTLNSGLLISSGAGNVVSGGVTLTPTEGNIYVDAGSDLNLSGSLVKP